MHRSKVGKKNIVKAKTVGGWLSKNTLPIMPSYYRLIAFTMGLDFFKVEYLFSCSCNYITGL